MSGVGGLEQGAGARELDVVTVRGDSEDVYGHGEPIYLFMAEGLDGVHARRPIGGIQSEREPDADAHAARQRPRSTAAPPTRVAARP